MKKLLSVLLAALLACACIFVCTAAGTDKISVRLNSDLAGKTAADYTAFAEVLGGSVVFDTEAPAGAISVADYAGTAYSGALKAGRTYDIIYLFCAANGAVLPGKLSADDLSVSCGKGANLSSFQITRRLTANGLSDEYELVLHARVTVDGNAFQRIVGKLLDLIAKIRAWSLY